MIRQENNRNRSALKHIKTIAEKANYVDDREAIADILNIFDELGEVEYMTEYNDNLKRIFRHYGKENQKKQLIQELAELIVAITKNDTDNFIEELADVQVMIDQFTLIYVNDHAVNVLDEVLKEIG